MKGACARLQRLVKVTGLRKEGLGGREGGLGREAGKEEEVSRKKKKCSAMGAGEHPLIRAVSIDLSSLFAHVGLLV